MTNRIAEIEARLNAAKAKKFDWSHTPQEVWDYCEDMTYLLSALTQAQRERDELKNQLESGELVRVVRCKDCVKFQTSACAMKHERALMDYCSSGKPKE